MKKLRIERWGDGKLDAVELSGPFNRERAIKAAQIYVKDLNGSRAYNDFYAVFGPNIDVKFLPSVSSTLEEITNVMTSYAENKVYEDSTTPFGDEDILIAVFDCTSKLFEEDIPAEAVNGVVYREGDARNENLSVESLYSRYEITEKGFSSKGSVLNGKTIEGASVPISLMRIEGLTRALESLHALRTEEDLKKIFGPISE